MKTHPHKQNHLSANQIDDAVQGAFLSTACVDMHTHLYPATFGKIGLWGIDELLTYHYLEAEFFRQSDMTAEQYWSLSKPKQADEIWKTLFVENTPISEATRGVIAVLKALGLTTGAVDLREAREYFADQSLDAHITKVFQIAGVSTVVMTNDPLDPEEASIWMKDAQVDPRFQAVLRLDRILGERSDPWQQLLSQGYKVDKQCFGRMRR